MGIYDRDYMRERGRDHLKASRRSTSGHSGDRLVAWARWLAIAGSALGAMVYFGKYAVPPNPQIVSPAKPSDNVEQFNKAENAPEPKIDFFRPLSQKEGK